jgi:hypothetical protein
VTFASGNFSAGVVFGHGPDRVFVIAIFAAIALVAWIIISGKIHDDDFNIWGQTLQTRFFEGNEGLAQLRDIMPDARFAGSDDRFESHFAKQLGIV